MRALLALLVVANLAFLALSRGWLEPYVGLSAMHQREPHRLNAQIEPQSVRVLAPPAAGPAAAAPGEAPAAALAPALTPAPASAPVPAPVPAPASSPAASPVASAASAAVPALACLQAGPLAAEQVPAVEAALQQLPAPAPAWQRVSAITAAGQVQVWLRIERADAALRQRLSDLEVPGVAFTACP